VPEITENDVLREILGLGHKDSVKAQLNGKIDTSTGIAWISKGVTLPHGTELRATYKGRRYEAKIENGAIVYEGKSFKSLSPAAKAVTGHPWNGWDFWEYKLPGKNNWALMNKLRK
jgi:hypothetical protein